MLTHDHERPPLSSERKREPAMTGERAFVERIRAELEAELGHKRLTVGTGYWLTYSFHTSPATEGRRNTHPPSPQSLHPGQHPTELPIWGMLVGRWITAQAESLGCTTLL